MAQHAANNAFNFGASVPRTLLAADQHHDRVPQSGAKRAPAGMRSIMINVFPNLAAPAEETLPRVPDGPNGNLPGQLKAPTERVPVAPPHPQFSPRLQPPNGKTDGKIYPA